MKFIHASDIHLDSPLVGLEKYPGAPVEEVRGATRQAFVNLIDLALAEEVDFVLLAGDLYNGDWSDYNTGLFMASQLSRLREPEISVFIVKGNHDAASQITRRLSMPGNVTVFSTGKPETVTLEKSRVALHGQSYATPAVSDNLAAGYPERMDGYFNIGLLHTALTGKEGHETYAPCSLADLKSKGYDYWALGHVHASEIVNRDPWVVFSGNLQGRHARELGPKGCMLVVVEDGTVVSVEERTLDVMRWTICEVDLSGSPDEDDAMGRIREKLGGMASCSDGMSRAVRVRLSGSCAVHASLLDDPERWTNEIRALATDEGGGQAWVEKVKLETGMEAMDGSALAMDEALGGLLHNIAAFEPDEEFLREALEGLKDLAKKLPVELRSGADPLDPGRPDLVQAFLDDARSIILERIKPGGDQA